MLGAQPATKSAVSRPTATADIHPRKRLMQHDDSIRRAKPAAPTVIGRGTIDVAGLGQVTIAWSERGVTSLELRPRPGAEPARDPLPPRVASVLTAYFGGEAVDPARELEVDLFGTPFQLSVWRALRQIPRGAVRTYAAIAIDAGSPRGMRAVGMANGANPVAVIVPCHRVVAHGLELGGFSAGIERKIWLLELEGVKVNGGKVVPGQLRLL